MIVKCLSIKQPWVWAIVNGKPVENRTWFSGYVGMLMLHASMGFDDEGHAWLVEHRAELGLPLVPSKESFPRGGIVARTNMIDCVTHHDPPYFFGPYGFVFRNTAPTKFYPCKGKLLIFEMDVPPEILQK